MTVTPTQRFRRSRPCPICGGGEDFPRGKGQRCVGFLSTDGEWAHCTREEYAGRLEPTDAEPPTYSHRLHGECGCGDEHAPERKDAPTAGRTEVAAYDYVDEQGALLFQVVRYEPKGFAQRRPDGHGGWLWKLNSTRRVLYRLPQVIAAVEAERTIYVVAGEKDVQALETAGEVATCNPMGEGKWKDAYSKVLRGANVVIVQDNDDQGRAHAAKVFASLNEVAASVQIVEAAEGKDAADHLAAGLTVDQFVPGSPPEDPETRKTSNEAAPVNGLPLRDPNRKAPGIASEPDLLSRFAADLAEVGLAGEGRSAKLIYLCLTSRALPWGRATNRLVSGIGKGTTSSGKSFLLKAVLTFFPEDAYMDLGSMSKRYLFYTEESFAHRFIVVPEWASIANDEELVALLRVLMSEGHVVHGTVDVEGMKRTARTIRKEGPTGLLMTTTQAGVDPELETRCLSFVTDDSPTQTRAVYKALAALEDEDDLPVDLEPWHDLQQWLVDCGENRVVIPYVRALAELMPASATRLRRDFVSMLCLVRAHALLHQQTRERDGRGRIVATREDYEAVHELLNDLIAEGVDASVSTATRETVEAVRELLTPPGTEYVTVKKLTDRLGVGQSATYDRVKRALKGGFLGNQTEKDERGYKLVLGAELPTDGEFLPSPEAVFRVLSGTPTGNANPVPTRDEPEFSGIPGVPVADPETDDDLDDLDREEFARDALVFRTNGDPPNPGEDGYLEFMYAEQEAGRISADEWVRASHAHERRLFAARTRKPEGT